MSKEIVSNEHKEFLEFLDEYNAKRKKNKIRVIILDI